MSGWLVGLIVIAVGFAGLGLQFLSLQIQRFPTDIRRPGPLIEVRRSKPPVVHSAELRRLVTVMSYAIINDPSASAELAGIFNGLEANASTIGEGNSSRRDQRRRSEDIARTIEELEQRWGIESPSS